MKKWLALVLLGMFLATVMVGCKKKEKEAEAPAAGETGGE
jgi:hypothetical protein